MQPMLLQRRVGPASPGGPVTGQQGMSRDMPLRPLSGLAATLQLLLLGS